MSQKIEAIYENGLFRPLQSVDLPEKSVVEIDLHLPEESKKPTKEHVQDTLSPEERVKRFLDWANEPRDVPELPDDALRREHIYEDRV